MVEKLQVDNPANKNLSYERAPLGVVYPPDYLPKYKIYSHAEAQQRYRNIEHDAYISAKKMEKDKTGIPAIIKIAIGLIGLGAAFIFLKNRAVSLYRKFK